MQKVALLQGRFLVSSPYLFVVKIICNCRGKSDLHNEYKLNTRLICPINFVIDQRTSKMRNVTKGRFFSHFLSEAGPERGGIPLHQIRKTASNCQTGLRNDEKVYQLTRHASGDLVKRCTSSPGTSLGQEMREKPPFRNVSHF